MALSQSGRRPKPDSCTAANSIFIPSSFILFSMIALASSAPFAFAAENAFGRASLSSATCLVNEGYPDCQADGSVPHSLTPKRSTTLFLCEEWD
jgi:hypothetical protein